VSEESFPPAVGSTVLFENDRVRVWEMTLAPGEHCDYHRHHHDHVILYPQAGQMRGQEFGGQEWGLVQEAEPGFVMYRTVGQAGPLPPHRLKNTGTETVVHYIVELLGESPSASAGPWQHNDHGRIVLPAQAP
jgi:quercetin dioxygenase-like cupin family protein